VFLVTDIAGLINKQHRNPVLNAIGLAQPGVVEHVVDEKKRSPVGGAYQDAQQFRIGHCRIEHRGSYWAGADGTTTPAWVPAEVIPPGLPSLGICPAPMTALFAFC